MYFGVVKDVSSGVLLYLIRVYAYCTEKMGDRWLTARAWYVCNPPPPDSSLQAMLSQKCRTHQWEFPIHPRVTTTKNSWRLTASTNNQIVRPGSGRFLGEITTYDNACTVADHFTALLHDFSKRLRTTIVYPCMHTVMENCCGQSYIRVRSLLDRRKW